MPTSPAVAPAFHVLAVPASPHASSPNHTAQGRFCKGNAYAYRAGALWTGNTAGHGRGASAKTILSRKETALTTVAVKLALEGTPATKEQAAQLRQFMDKLLPNATLETPTVHLNFGLLPGGYRPLPPLERPEDPTPSSGVDARRA